MGRFFNMYIVSDVHCINIIAKGIQGVDIIAVFIERLKKISFKKHAFLGAFEIGGEQL